MTPGSAGMAGVAVARARGSRWVMAPLAAAVIVLAMLWLMHFMTTLRAEPPAAAVDVQGVDVVEAEPPEDEPPDAMEQLESAPPPPPMAPAALQADAPALPNVALAAPADAGPIKVPMSIGGGSPTLAGSGAFGGFGSGSGTGGGYGQGQGFKGKELVPLSTARPQISRWAYERGIEGWVEVVFTVMPNGRVTDVKIIDAQPKGIFEAAAVESISNWIYAEHPKARMVKQRVEFKLEDFQYNWR